MKTVAFLTAAAVCAVSLSACVREDAPKDSAVAAAMPDTSAPRLPNQAMTAPDAGATGVVPADGSQPPVAQTPAMGTAGGAMSQPSGAAAATTSTGGSTAGH